MLAHGDHHVKASAGGRVVPCARVRLAQTGRALHWQLLNVLGKRSALADEDNWYANLSGSTGASACCSHTPTERRIVDLLKGALLEGRLPINALGRLTRSVAFASMSSAI